MSDGDTNLRHQGHIGAHLVLGGVDPTGVHLFTVAAHGSTDKLPYVTMGSGSLAAMAVFETGWRAEMSVCKTLHKNLHVELTWNDSLERRSPCTCLRCGLRWYLQRPGIWFQCRRMYHHQDTNRDASQLRNS